MTSVRSVFFFFFLNVFRESVGLDFQAELSDMLLLKMLRSATQASGDKDRVYIRRAFFFLPPSEGVEFV